MIAEDFAQVLDQMDTPRLLDSYMSLARVWKRTHPSVPTARRDWINETFQAVGVEMIFRDVVADLNAREVRA